MNHSASDDRVQPGWRSSESSSLDRMITRRSFTLVEILPGDGANAKGSNNETEPCEPGAKSGCDSEKFQPVDV